jgi:hypothetical protein
VGISLYESQLTRVNNKEEWQYRATGVIWRYRNRDRNRNKLL